MPIVLFFSSRQISAQLIRNFWANPSTPGRFDNIDDAFPKLWTILVIWCVLAVFSFENKAVSWQNQQNYHCAQRRLSSAQSDQSPRCPHEETLGPQLPIERTSKTLIRLGGSEFSLGAQTILLVLSWNGSIVDALNTIIIHINFQRT